MILIYSPVITNRIEYIFQLLLGELSGQELKFTDSKSVYLDLSGPKICYAPEPINQGLFLRSAGLLHEAGVHETDPAISYFNGEPILFPVNSEQSCLPFDIGSASFFMVSRYEEYLEFKQDQFGRFPGSESLAFKNNFLLKPIVNIWLSWFQDKIKSSFPEVNIQKPEFRFIPTIDIDIAYAYLGRRFYRTMGGFLRSAFQNNWKEISERYKVITGKEPDPFDTYDFLEQIHANITTTPVIFILAGRYNPLDKNLPLAHPLMRKLLFRLTRNNKIGIHPSYTSNQVNGRLHKEVKDLSKKIETKIVLSRQHFLKLRFPDTYQQLISQGIQEDYTMGFADQLGFRAGICNPFFFYDLKKEETTSLRVFPFVYMDGTLHDYLGLKPNEATILIQSLIYICKKHNGTFISLWHNESLNDQRRWKGWRKVYQLMISELEETKL